MKKLILAGLAVLLVFSVTGCSTLERTQEIGAEREAKLNEARLAAKAMDATTTLALAAIPACRMEAAKGETITLGGVSVFECHGGVFVSGNSGSEIQERQSRLGEWMMAQGNNVFGFATLCLVFGACGLGGTGALPAIGPSPENVLIPTQVIEQPTVIFAP